MHGTYGVICFMTNPVLAFSSHAPPQLGLILRASPIHPVPRSLHGIDRLDKMNSSGHRYRIRSPINSPRLRTAGESQDPLPLPTLDTSDDIDSESDSDTAIDDSGREGSSTPNSRETSVPPTHHSARFAGLHDESFANQAIVATIPYEIILNIFRYLEPFSTDHYNCLFVCKSWAKCAVENVWFRPSIKNVGTFYKFASTLKPNDRKVSLFPYSHFVKRLNLLNISKEITTKQFEKLADCTQLERLTMGGALQITDRAVAQVIPKFQKLLALDISQVDLEDEGLSAVAMNCRLLQGLNVSHCSRLTDQSIMTIATNCHNLRRVYNSKKWLI